ncbi:MAG TPA: HAMP domain-containing sensor histidine kinase [Mucilaginibacter sp.]|jgi:two-component system phosphate regulon sensor histidine kinase PhoR|nr:HAMP domain-containing sensor histidine kinase [Mucilaginibacter sp.]
MKTEQGAYRKNFSLIIAFLILISVTFIVALFIAYSLTARYVENEFASKKIDVLDQTIKPYNDFFYTRIPEITFYQGYLDSTSAAKYSASVFNDYPFVKRIVFYDVTISSPNTLSTGNGLDIGLKSVFEFLSKKQGKVIGSKKALPEDYVDFETMVTKLNNFVALADTSREPTQDEKFRTFYDIQPEPEKISYLNIPRREDVKRYRELLQSHNRATVYKQNMLTFALDQFKLKVRNTHPELYKDVSIRPVVYDPIENENTNIITEAAFSGAFSNYKLYFSSPKSYLAAEINKRFMPTGAMVLLIYVFLVLIGWLIYRNLNVNLKLFKLQYDFINNFTHEFKTPVSVIKIAGSNLRSDSELSDRQIKHYGKILDEEADKLNDLMNKLLSFTQLENNAISLKKEEIDLGDFVKGYMDTFKIKYPDFKIHHKIHGITTFYTDPVLLGSIFQNLMENAYKYSDPKRKELNIDVRKEKKDIIFSFTDKGIGISNEEITHIFKKFYRIENQYNLNGSVGLGLAFCKELANFMDGDITVNSKIHEGSQFVVTLPYETVE